MPQEFLSNTDEMPLRISREASNRKSVKVLIMGSPKGVNNIIQTLYRLGFAEVTAWSSLQPTANPTDFLGLIYTEAPAFSPTIPWANLHKCPSLLTYHSLS